MTSAAGFCAIEFRDLASAFSPYKLMDGVAIFLFLPLALERFFSFDSRHIQRSPARRNGFGIGKYAVRRDLG